MKVLLGLFSLALLGAAAAAWRLRGLLAESERTARGLAERLEAEVAELSAGRSRLSAILEHMVEAVAAVDLDGRVAAVNPALCALFAVRAQDCLGQTFIEALRHARLQELLSAALAERRAQVSEVSLLAPEERHFEAHAVPLTRSGDPGGALLILHDITRLRLLERMRRDFVANVSHELRTPLASIKASAETLREGAMDDKKHRGEFVEAIEADAERLARLVDDLLDLSAIESGQKPKHLEDTDLLALAREAAFALSAIARKSKVAVTVAEGALPRVRVDRGQFKRVLTNLLENAVKFNREGGTVAVSGAAEGRTVVLSVSDTGDGIPDEDLPRVFERFYRVDKARSREAGGTGLGLSIVKHIVEAHGGSVSAESAPGEGSTFRVRLPLGGHS